jgi:hypothetical protein
MVVYIAENIFCFLFSKNRIIFRHFEIVSRLLQLAHDFLNFIALAAVSRSCTPAMRIGALQTDLPPIRAALVLARRNQLSLKWVWSEVLRLGPMPTSSSVALHPGPAHPTAISSINNTSD